MFNILVVEDDAGTRKLLCALLKSDGYNVLSAQDGAEALEVLDKNHVDLLDAALDCPYGRLHSYGAAAWRGQHPSHADAFGKGRCRRRKARLCRGHRRLYEKTLRRGGAAFAHTRPAAPRKDSYGKKDSGGSVTLDYDSLTVTTDKGRETLPQKEFLLLFKLLSYPDVVFTRLQLMDEIWGMDAESDEHTVNVHINRLRTRFAHCDDFEIVTVRGLGYKAVRKNAGDDGR